MIKGKVFIAISLILVILLGGCGLFSNSAQLKDIAIVIDGNPDEWDPFPSVHEDPKGDNISIDYDMSTIKAFTNNETGIIYILVESYITPKDLTTVEVDFLYGDEYYRVGLPVGEGFYGVIARQTGEDDQWETIEDSFEYNMITDKATEISFSISNWPNPKELKIAQIRIMGGICCNQYEYYAIDYMN